MFVQRPMFVQQPQAELWAVVVGGLLFTYVVSFLLCYVALGFLIRETSS